MATEFFASAFELKPTATPVSEVDALAPIATPSFWAVLAAP